MNIVKVRPGQRVTQQFDVATFYELELPWWPKAVDAVKIEGVFPPLREDDTLRVRLLAADEAVHDAGGGFGAVAAEAGRQIIVVGGIPGAWYGIAVGDLRFDIIITHPAGGGPSVAAQVGI